MKKHIKAIIVAAIVFVFIAFMGTKATLDINKEHKIKNEISEIMLILDNSGSSNNINEILDRRIIKKGKYRRVENTLKLYFKDLSSDYENLKFLLANDNWTFYLTGENLKEDGPAFIKSKDKIQNSKAQIEEYYNKINNKINNNDTKLSYIGNTKMDKYYRNLYLEIIDESIPNDFKKSLKTMYDDNNKKVKIYEDALNFLIANKGHWKVEKEVIVFDEQTLLDEYIRITKTLENKVVSES